MGQDIESRFELAEAHIDEQSTAFASEKRKGAHRARSPLCLTPLPAWAALTERMSHPAARLGSVD